MSEMDAAIRLIEQLGVAGVLLVVLIGVIRRYDSLGETLGDRIDKINDKRVTEARESSEVAKQTLDMGVRLVEAMSRIAESMDQVSQRMERAAELNEQAARTIKDAAAKLDRRASGEVS